MKIRKGFVTNSSSTNFGTMLVSSLGSVGIASILNVLNTDFQAKKKSYVRLVVEAPSSRFVLPGDLVPLRAHVVKVDIEDGVILGEPTIVAEASIDCVTGCDLVESSGSDHYITTNDSLLKNSSGQIRFEISALYEGQVMKANVDFSLAIFTIDPQEGVFVTNLKNEEPLIIQCSVPVQFNYAFDPNLLETEKVLESERKLELKLIENITEPKDLFNKFSCRVKKNYTLEANMNGYVAQQPYSALFLNECILVPKQLKEPIVIKCYKDEEANKRTEKSFVLPIKVLKYDEKKKNLQTDADLSNSLQFEFYAKSQQGHLTNEAAQQVVEKAQLTAELLPDDGAADAKRPYARYRIYANALAEAELDKLEIFIRIISNGENIEEIQLDGILLPRIDLKGLIRQFIQYPLGTLAGQHLILGNVDTYMGALDYLSDIEMIKSGDPKYHPGKNIMYLYEIPESLESFKKVQTIYHELAHVIEEMNGDESKSKAWDERHSYFMQYMSDVAFLLAKLERGAVSDIQATIGEAIENYHEIYFNWANEEEKANTGEINSWFGARCPTPHKIFDKYLNFPTFCNTNHISDDLKDKIAQLFAKHYFPGNIMGRWRENGGLFDGTTWRISWNRGFLNKLIPEVKGYAFTETSRRWVGGNQLKLEIDYFVIRDSDKDEDDLTAVLDAGPFQPDDPNYPSIQTIKLTWKANRTLSECILGDHRDKEYTLTRI
ncbi:hypothetical protein J0B03_08485 [Alkalibacter rhizosphaerae]|uniref:Uncharacterized protein n=1 Tax=Alkalibacter rhizosphaerae TaxID=2815577 RepID=A0A974XKW6_9FIRM|nr:hypothetical protein [Alkalibacter rhizosphaerae]QSX07846.1 hypothetical protein J0B03_08485 [Alkalibacter rhizosphaerae]